MKNKIKYFLLLLLASMAFQWPLDLKKTVFCFAASFLAVIISYRVFPPEFMRLFTFTALKNVILFTLMHLYDVIRSGIIAFIDLILFIPVNGGKETYFSTRIKNPVLQAAFINAVYLIPDVQHVKSQFADAGLVITHRCGNEDEEKRMLARIEKYEIVLSDAEREK
ncbi:MAG: hypothetical protein JW803_02995 [Endomicrobiales bacterium]|nr:hypothetical protein [Endomicrobiales bacterium]